MSLSDLSAIVTPAAGGAASELAIDLAELLGLAPDPETVLRWRKPSIAQMYAAGDVAAALQKKHPLWAPGLLSDVALLSLAHTAPSPAPGETIAGFYEGLVEGPHANDRLFWYLLERFVVEWPDIARTELVAELAKRRPEIVEKLTAFGMPSETLKKTESSTSADAGTDGIPSNSDTSTAASSANSKPRKPIRSAKAART